MLGAAARLAGATFARFLLIGAIGFLVDLSLFAAARLVLPDLAARGAALVVAITATWWLNRRVTFRSHDPAVLAEWLRYLATSLVGAATNATISLTLLWNLPGTSTVGAVAIGSISALVLNFVLAKRLAYRSPSSTGTSSTPY